VPAYAWEKVPSNLRWSVAVTQRFSPGALQRAARLLLADRPGPCTLRLESDRAESRTCPAVLFFLWLTLLHGLTMARAWPPTVWTTEFCTPVRKITRTAVAVASCRQQK